MLSLWVLMDPASRAMVLPGKSGVAIEGTVRGLEPAIPRSLAPQAMANQMLRRVHYTQLDVNGHMNNTRYLDWVEDLLPAEFHREHPVKEFTICYLNEALEGEEVALNWQLDSEGNLHVHAAESTGGKRVFSAEVLL
jgi:acyl-ACP thioesterase